MTSLTDTIACLHAHLDETPTDWQLRCVLADAYEQAGDCERAAFQRWCAGTHKSPLLWKTGEVSWHRRHVVDYSPYMLSINLFDRLQRGRKLLTSMCDYTTRQAAEDDLFQAWQAWRTNSKGVL